ncbi:nicotinamide mononucleotide transporter [Mycoplasma seminis]|uniref:Nicotinamide mononucleotide transporter n=1 Tax=Mycoplasma seminis TaxID=512749 RepID=A0ABY9H9M3_9MOLU|nr:nicotinamide mononucleotide transporter [Mycoplasma seminis]WLP85227.1 nicotinamide mononucleotide transporter [Mycoplasma seminis]
MFKKVYLEYLFIFLLSLLVFIFSIYDINTDKFIWSNSNTALSRFYISMIMISGLSGIIATYLFYKRVIYAYPLAILNAISYGIFAWSLDLFIDVVIYVLVLPLIFIYFWFITAFKFKIKSYKLEIKWISIVITLFIIAFIIFYFTQKALTTSFQSAFKKEIIEFGSNFKFKTAGYVVITLSNAILIIAVVMMLRGFKEVWLIWQMKNIFSIVFYSGIAVINWSVVVINICYMLLSIYIFIRSFTMRKITIAITGPGCVGKSTILGSKQIQEFLNQHNFHMIQERDYEDNENDYILALKKQKSFWDSQKFFFKTQQDDIERAMLIENQNVIFDRHMLDSFIYPQVQIENNLYSQDEIKQWNKLETVKNECVALLQKRSRVFYFSTSKMIGVDNEYKFKKFWCNWICCNEWKSNWNYFKFWNLYQ